MSNISYIAFTISFLPSLFEGFEMSVFSYIAVSDNRTSGNRGTIIALILVILMNYATYLYLPILITDTVEYEMKLGLGFLFISLATWLLFYDGHSSMNAFFTALIGIVTEGVEVDLLSVSSFVITGQLLPAFLGGFIGFLSVLIISKFIFLKFNRNIMRKVAIGIMYSVAFIILTSGFT